MELVNTNGMMVNVILVNGNKIKCVELVHILGLMEENMLVIDNIYIYLGSFEND